MSDAERQRLRRMRSKSKQREFLVGRSSMRRVLGALTGTAPADVALEFGEHGKPWMPEERLHFNLSHSADRAVLAVARRGPVGIDIEAMAPRRPFSRLARRFFAPGEVEWFERHSERERRAAFYRMWTLKEAFLKQLGTGLSLSSRAFEVAVDGDAARLAVAPSDGPDTGPVALTTIYSDADYVISTCTPEDLVDYRLEDLHDIAGGSP